MKFNCLDEFKGRVKLIKVASIFETKRENKSLIHSNRSSSIFEFDENSNKLAAIHCDADENVTSQTEYQYNDVGQLVFEKTNGKGSLKFETDYLNSQKFEHRSYDSENNLRSTSRYLYDTKNRLVYAASFNPNGSLSSRTEITYDGMGGRVQEELVDEYIREGNLGSIVKDSNNFDIDIDVDNPCYQTVKYGPDNNPISAAFYDCNKIMQKKYEFDYSARGCLKELREYYGSFATQHPEVNLPTFLANALFSVGSAYSYAKEGYMSESLQSIINLPLVSKINYRFDFQGRIVNKESYFLGKRITYWRFEYGEHGKLTRETHREADNSILFERAFDWKFDEQNNWIEQTITESPARPYKDTKSVTIISRDIKYF